MGTIWLPPQGGFTDGPGIVCVGSLDTDPLHPWGRTNPWAYDGLIYGFRELADTPGSGFQYSVLGGVMTICTSDPDILGSDKLYWTSVLNAGANKDPFAVSHVLTLDWDNDTDGSGDPSTIITCTSDGGSAEGVMKGSMAVWGIVRDVLTMNNLGNTETPIRQGYSVTAGLSRMEVSFDDIDGRALWTDVLVPEVAALWNEH